MIFREAAETILHVPPGDAVEGTQLPVAEIAGELFKVQFFGARRPVFSDIALEGSATLQMTGWAERRSGVARL